jgi:hypothetical protein
VLLFVASLVSFPRRKSVRRVVEWHDLQSKILNITKIYQLIFFEMGEKSPELLHLKDAHDFFFIRLFTNLTRNNTVQKIKLEATLLTYSGMKRVTIDR